MLSKSVDVLQILSILAAAAFGALALFGDYKRKGGGITPAGYVAVAGIVLSAILSLATQWGQQEIDRAKGDKERKAQVHRDEQDSKRFERQMEKLTRIAESQNRALAGTYATASRLDRSLREQRSAFAQLVLLRQGMRRSLSSQRGIQIGLGRSLNVLSGMRRQEKNSTAAVLRSLWEEANRIEGQRIELLVTSDCHDNSVRQAAPVIGPGTMAWLTLLTGEEVRAKQERSGGWDALAGLDRTLFTMASEPLLWNDPEEGGWFTRFHSFTSLEPDEISHPEAWQGKIIELNIVARLPAGERGKAIKNALPCKLSVNLKANGRALADFDGELALQKNGGQLLFEARSPVRADNLPTFELLTAEPR